MKRALLIAGVLAGTASLLWVYAQTPGGNAKPLASLFPSGPVLYLEARNFQTLLRDWNGSREKRLWLASDHYQVFSRSNLAQKLQSAQNEFASAAGLPPNLALLENIAGAESAVAIYDIGKLQFLYITRLPEAAIGGNALWKQRGNYAPRRSSGLDYYFKYDKASDRTAVFAASNGYLLLATREDLLAGALSLLAGETLPSIAGESWYESSVQAAQSQGELRLVLNMPRLLESPYMRSYWIQRNASELRQYSASISDLTRGPDSIRENRILFRVTGETPSWNESAVAQLLRLVPAGAGFSRASASPTAQQALELIWRKILEPQPGAGPEGQLAPAAGLLDTVVGSEADLEIRIDEKPSTAESAAIPEALRKLLEAERLEAMLEIGATRSLPDGVFVGIDSAVVLLRGSNWDPAAVRNALASTGASLTGPSAVFLAVDGPVLIVANRREFLQTISAAIGKPATPTVARYAASYQHASELPNFEKMTRLIDNPLRTEGPMFFSQNVASLGRSLERLDSAAIVVHDTGAVVSQNLLYKLKP